MRQTLATGLFAKENRTGRTSHHAPPFLFVHGDKDSSTLIEDAREFAGRLRAVSGNEVLLAELPGGQHAFDLMFALRYSYVVEAVTAYAAARRR